MEGYLREEKGCPKLLDLIPKDQKWVTNNSQEIASKTEEKKLELSLGLSLGTGGIDNHHHYNNNNSYGYFQNTPCVKNPVLQTQKWPFDTVMKEANSQPCNNSSRDVVEKKMAFSPAAAVVPSPANTAHKRTAPAVVGWPPIRSFRKNIASGSTSKDSKLSPETQNPTPGKVSGQKPVESSPKTLFVKINMDGIPIGRKVDLKAYDSYEKLACAVDELFRGLLAAQSEDKNDEGMKKIGGLLDGSGEYTLVYEDNEGDRMLVGDVPWHMFVSTVKRLRVLKSSELPSLSRGTKQGKLSMDS